MAERYYLGQPLLNNIRRTITRVNGMSENVASDSIPVRIQELHRLGFRPQRGTFTATSWAVGQTLAVTVLGGTDTVSVTNYCTPIKGQSNATQALNVIFGNVMGTVSVLEVQQPTCTMSIGGIDLTTLPGYDGGVMQLLGHAATSSGTACYGLQWYSVTQCGTTA